MFSIPHPRLFHCSLIAIVAFGVFSLAVTAFAQDYDLEAMRELNPRMPPPLELDEAAMEAAGFEKVSGEFVDLWTDIHDGETVPDLVKAFDAAVPIWCDMFSISRRRIQPWRLIGFVMADVTRFKDAGLIPDVVPEFPAGFNWGHHFWVIAQPGDYYTRHLVLHEGTHAVMQWFLGGSGPSWYSEGMAERIGLHQWKDHSLTLRFRPQNSQEVDYWGRPRLIDDARRKGEILRLDQIFDFQQIQFYDVKSYAWAWAACEFLSEHPLTRDAFQRMQKRTEETGPEFSAKFKRMVSRDWEIIERDWELFVDELTYGARADLAAPTQIEFADGANGERSATLEAGHSWQISDVQVAMGDSIALKAVGRYQIIDDGQSVPCEAAGITLRYYRNRPLGELTGVIVDANGKFGAPFPIGTSCIWTADRNGSLAFRINERPSELADNEGTLELKINTVSK